MRLNVKVTVFSVFLTITMVSVIVAVGSTSFRQFALATEQEYVASIAELVRTSLTSSMRHGIQSERDEFLQKIAQIEGMHGVLS